MSELLAVALRMMARRGRTVQDDVNCEFAPLPSGLPYADYVRRFDPDADPLAARRATAVAQLVRMHRTFDTLNGLARARGARAGWPDSEHLYQAHGEPRD